MSSVAAVQPYPRLAAAAVAVLVAGIPAPQCWALMILGFDGMGRVLRSRRWSRGAAAV